MDDFDRPLNDRGLHDAPVMALRFTNREEPVDVLVSSPAKRAITTARAFASALGNAAIKEERALYLADVPALMTIIEALPHHAASAMLFGHNPGLSLLVQHLADGRLGDLPTCAAVRIDLAVDSWRETASGTGTITWWDAPKLG